MSIIKNPSINFCFFINISLVLVSLRFEIPLFLFLTDLSVYFYYCLNLIRYQCVLLLLWFLSPCDWHARFVDCQLVACFGRLMFSSSSILRYTYDFIVNVSTSVALMNVWTLSASRITRKVLNLFTFCLNNVVLFCFYFFGCFDLLCRNLTPKTKCARNQRHSRAKKN